MVQNEFIQCLICDTVINLRIQASDLKIPFIISCPVCTGQIKGIFQPDSACMNISHLTNANLFSSEVKPTKCWSFELSAELPTRKVFEKDFKVDINELSPYMKMVVRSQGNVEYLKLTKIFIDFYNNGRWDMLMNLLRLSNDRRFEFVIPMLNKILPNSLCALNQVTDELQAITALHQMLLTDSGLISIVGTETLKDYTKVAKQIFSMYKGKKINSETLKYFNYANFNSELLQVLDSISEIYPKILPALSLRLIGDKDMDSNDQAMTTVDAEQLNAIYAQTYQFILRHLEVVYRLNNLFSRNSVNKFISGKTEDEFLKYSEFNRLKKFLNPTEFFSRPVSSLKNNVRNAIQHFDYNVNYNDQKIIYNDRGKKVTLTYLNLSSMVIDNLSMVLYINELIYSLRKVSLVINMQTNK